ncbi:hypothetical protein EXW39_27745 (plasmid) [Bacillus mycoides]|uniref:hypothetical protein n=1 Tax=Bacillus mycoides TaxID=1405 RepID=UPI001C01A15E|nr:hypothetical protein [Bacillus mycoides]QWH63900.1 hypothetical protein EXW39_27745 [Bacillus mycoides]
MAKDTVRRNQAGAVIHNDINDFMFLNIPMIIKEDDAPLFEVLSVGTAGKDNVAAVSIDRITMSRNVIQIATIRNNDGSVQAYRLPFELDEWVRSCMNAAYNGRNPFPCKVAFGIIDNKFYVEFK